MYSEETGLSRQNLLEELRRLAPQLGALILLLMGGGILLPLLKNTLAIAEDVRQLEEARTVQRSLLKREPQLRQEAEIAAAQQRLAASRFAPPDILDSVLKDLVVSAESLPTLQLRSYSYRADGTVLVDNDRYGPALKGRLLENTIQLELVGNFTSTLSYLGKLERRTPRLVLSGFTTSLEDDSGNNVSAAAPTPLTIAGLERPRATVDRGRIVTRMNVTAISLITPQQAESFRQQEAAQQK